MARRPTVERLIEHYSRLGLPDGDGDERKAWSTKNGYRSYLRNWINPRWGQYRLTDVRTIHVEDWLRSIPGEKLQNGSKAKIRSIMSAIFNHAIRHEWLEAGYNPITLVRQGAQRGSIPETLTVAEISMLWRELDLRERAMLSIEYSKGLRVSEGFGLKFSDFDFVNLTVCVQRGFVKGHLGKLKTEASKRLMPLDRAGISVVVCCVGTQDCEN